MGSRGDCRLEKGVADIGTMGVELPDVSLDEGLLLQEELTFSVSLSKGSIRTDRLHKSGYAQ